MTATTEIYLADTYALIELIGGNRDYQPYLDATLLTTKLNLAELYYHLLREYNAKTADHYLDLYSRITIEVSITSIRNGMALKLKHKHERLSYTDCIAYALAHEIGIRFLTGDEKFKTRANVEYVR